MKRKIIKIIIPIIIILSVIITFNYFLDLGQIIILIRPSGEMKRLKQIEDSLNLPPSARRYLVDKGAYVDSKGARHYSRSISNYYEDKELTYLVKEKIEKNGWFLEHTIDTLAGGMIYEYVKSEVRDGIYGTKLYITINQKSIGDPHLLNDDHSITIKSTVEELDYR